MDPHFVIHSAGRTRDVLIVNGDAEPAPFKRVDALRMLPRKHHTEVASRTIVAAMAVAESARDQGLAVQSVAMDHGPSLNIVTHHMPDWAAADWAPVPPASVSRWKAFWETVQKQGWAFIEA